MSHTYITLSNNDCSNYSKARHIISLSIVYTRHGESHDADCLSERGEFHINPQNIQNEIYVIIHCRNNAFMISPVAIS